MRPPIRNLASVVSAGLVLLSAAAALPAAEPREWVLRCADPERARAALRLAALGEAGLPAGARLEAALAGPLPMTLQTLLRFRLPDDAEVADWRKPLLELARPVWLEPAPLRRTDEIPDDSRYGELWALPHIQAPVAWDVVQGNGSVVLAVVDTGSQLDHPDLAGALWTNAVEAAGQPGVDDDGNGLVDDLHGGDLLELDGDPSPAPGDFGHGTHTAGTAACVTDNGTGVACAAWNARLMPVRAGHLNSISRGVEGVWYAARAGADIISCSWGGDDRSSYEDEVIQAVRELGVLVVASAGNDGSERPHYPGAYDGVLCVASTGSDDRRSGSSQHGWWVDLCAPGSEILSCLPGSGYGLRSGTSMATPLVASLAALAAGRFPGESGDQLRERLKAACVDIDALNPGDEGKLGSGRIQALATVTQAARAFQVEGLVVTDANANGVVEPGEAVGLRLSLRGLLGTLGGLVLTAALPEGGGTLTDAQISVGSLAAGQLVQPVDGLSLTVSADLEPGSQLRVHLLATAAGGFTQEADLLLAVAPTYVTHDNSQLQLSVSGEGVQGYYDWEQSQAVGDGLRWPPGSPSHLYHGSLLLALDGGSVAHDASALLGQPSEFHVLSGSEIRREEDGLMLRSEAEFTADGLAGLRVRQDVHSWTGENGVLLRWTLHNTGAQTLVGLQPGIWMDLDIAGSYVNDTGGWDGGTGTGWLTDAGGVRVGARWLSDAPWAYRVCQWGEWAAGGLTDPELFGWMRGGFQQVETGTPDDQQLLLAAPPATLAPGQRREVVLALVAGASAQALATAAQLLDDHWQALELGETAPARPGGLELAVWPNPFNPATSFHYQAQRPGSLHWEVRNLAGRRVLAGTRALVPAGAGSEGLDLSGQASGLYLLQVSQGGLHGAERLLLVR